MVSVSNLVVQYGSFTALQGLTVDIPDGCVGLLGPNGAGKTTLLKALLGFVKPTQGSATINGLDAATQGKEVRQTVGLMPEQDCHIPGMNAVSFVAYAGELSGMPPEQALGRAHEVLEYCGLGEARYRNVETYSTGMRQRIKLAQALVHGPKLLLLDEPTNGLDPAGREEMLELIRSVSHGKGLNIIISSHLLPDIERTCDTVVALVGGQLRAQGSIKDLKRVGGDAYDVELRDESDAFESLARQAGYVVERLRYSSYRVKLSDGESASKVLLQLAKESGAQVRGLIHAERTLEEAFLSTINS